MNDAELQMAMADSIILATTRTHNATLWTQDADFKGIEGVEYIEKRYRIPQKELILLSFSQEKIILFLYYFSLPPDRIILISGILLSSCFSP